MISVKNGCAAQSNSTQPTIARRGRTRSSLGARSMLHQIAEQARRHRSFDSVSPELAISCTAVRMRSTSPARGSTQASTACRPGRAVADHRGGEAPLGLADRIERAVEREPVEIVGDLDAARRARDAVELEERAGREVGRGDIRRPACRCGPRPSTMSGAAASAGRLAMRARKLLRHAGVRSGSLARAVSARARLLRQHVVERGRHRRDAGAIVLDDVGQALREIDIAQEPDDAVEQQVLRPRRRARAAACPAPCCRARRSRR